MLFHLLLPFLLPGQTPTPKLRLIPGGGEQRIVDLEASADGSRIVTNGLVMGAYHSNASRLWDARRGRVVAVFTHNFPIYSTDLSDGASRVLTVSKDEAKVWNATTGELIKRYPAPDKQDFGIGTISPDGSSVALATESGELLSYVVDSQGLGKTVQIGGFGLASLRYSPDGTKLVGTLDNFDDDKPMGPVVWAASDLQPIVKFSSAKGSDRWATFSPQADRVVSLLPEEKGGKVRLYSVDSPAPKAEAPGADADTLRPYAPPVFLGPRGDLIAAPQADGRVALLDGKSGAAAGFLTGSTGPLLAMAASWDGTRVAACGQDGAVHAWTVATRQPIPVGLVEGRATSLTFSSEGDLWVGDESGGLRRLSLVEGTATPLLGPGCRIYAGLVTFPKGRFATSRPVPGGQQWEVFDGANHAPSRFGLPPSAKAPVFSPDGTKAVVLAPNGKAGALLIDLATGKNLILPDASAAAWQAKGAWAIVAGRNGMLRRYDGATFEAIGETQFKVNGAARDVAVSPDGKLAAVAGFTLPAAPGKEIAILWDIAAGKALDVPFTAGDPNARLRFSPDGKKLGLLNGNQVVRYDLTTRKGLVTQLADPVKLDGHQIPAKLIDFEFSPDGNRVIAKGTLGTIYKVDFATGKVATVDGPGYLAASDPWAISRDQRTGLNVNGNQVEVWDLTTQQQIAKLPLSDGGTKAVFLPDERRVLTADMTDGVVVWDFADRAKPKRLGSFLRIADGRWLAMDAEGRYDAADPSDVEGASYVYAWSGGLEPIEVAQMKSRYYEPNLLGKLLGVDSEPRRAVPEVDALKLYPGVRITPKADQFAIEVSDRDDGGVGTVEVFVNGKSVAKRKSGGYFTLALPAYRPFLIPSSRLRPGERNELRVVASNETNDLRSPAAVATIPLPSDLVAPPVHLFALCVGVGNYVGDAGDLKSPPSDAAAIANALLKVSPRLLPDGVDVTLLTTDAKDDSLRPSRARIMRWFDETAKKASAGDIAVVFFAGHGTNRIGDASDYFFLTADYNPSDVGPAAIGVATISGEDLRTGLAKIPASKQVVVLDTCHSGAASKSLALSRSLSGDYGRAYESIREASGTWVLAGASADQLSYESSSVDHGMLTYALLEAIDRASPEGLRKAESGDLFVDVESWLKYAVGRVESLKSELDLPGVQQPELRNSTAGGSFDIGVTSSSHRGELGLRPPRPVVIVGGFNGANDEDPLHLEKAVGEALGDSKRLKPWFDVAAHPGAFRVGGSYAVASGTVTVKVIVQRFDGAGDRKTVRTVPLTGTKGDLKALAIKIRAAVEETITNLSK